MPDFIPRSDGQYAGFVANFVKRVAESPELYEVEPIIVDRLQARLAHFQATYQEAMLPNTRTVVMVTNKNAARECLSRLIRRIAAQVRPSTSISDGDKILLGLMPRKKRVKEIPAPETSPGIYMLHSMRDRLIIKLYDPTLITRKGKPPRVNSAEVWYQVTDQTPDNSTQWIHAGITTDLKLIINYTEEKKPGTPIYLRACWNNRRGKRGPMSNPYVFNVGVGFAWIRQMAA